MSERYVIKAKLGEGGSGQVYRAWDSNLDRTVALKRLLGNENGDAAEHLRKDLLREASLLSSIQHPNVCQVYDFGVDEEGGYVVMEFVNGEDLEESARRRVSVDEFAGIAEQTLEGVVAAHAKNILHRDLKPANVMINWLPNAQFRVKVLDFGLARFVQKAARQPDEPAAQSTKGTIYFMAPEQFRGKEPDSRTDLYALGCLFFYLLTARHPFDGDTVGEIMDRHLEGRQSVQLSALRSDLPAPYGQWIAWLMNCDPQHRPSSATEALQAFRHLRMSLGQPQPATSFHIPVQPPQPVYQPVYQAPPGHATGRVPVARQATGQVPRAATGQVPRAPLAAAPRQPAPPVQDEEEMDDDAAARAEAAKKRNIIVAISIGAAAALAAAGFAITNRPKPVPPDVTSGAKSQPASQPQPSPEPPPTAATAAAAAMAPVVTPIARVSSPPQATLIAWFDAHEGVGVFEQAGLVPSVQDNPVDHWNDRAPGAGNNPAIYHDVTVEKSAAKHLPILRNAARDKAGLRGTHPVIRFEGEDNLVSGRGRRDASTGNPLEGQFSAGTATIVMFFRLKEFRKDEKPRPILAIQSRKLLPGWVMQMAGTTLGAGPAGQPPVLSLTYPPGAHDFRTASLVITKNGPASLRLRLPDGGTLTAVPVNTLGLPADPTLEIRLGGARLRNGPVEYFSGDLAEVLIYNTALTAADVTAAEDYLLTRYCK